MGWLLIVYAEQHSAVPWSADNTTQYNTGRLANLFISSIESDISGPRMLRRRMPPMSIRAMMGDRKHVVNWSECNKGILLDCWGVSVECGVS